MKSWNCSTNTGTHTPIELSFVRGNFPLTSNTDTNTTRYLKPLHAGTLENGVKEISYLLGLGMLCNHSSICWRLCKERESGLSLLLLSIESLSPITG